MIYLYLSITLYLLFIMFYIISILCGVKFSNTLLSNIFDVPESLSSERGEIRIYFAILFTLVSMLPIALIISSEHINIVTVEIYYIFHNSSLAEHFSVIIIKFMLYSSLILISIVNVQLYEKYIKICKSVSLGVVTIGKTISNTDVVKFTVNVILCCCCSLVGGTLFNLIYVFSQLKV